MLDTSWAGGLVAGCCWVQVVPFQVQVSDSGTFALSTPPKSTATPCPESYARLAAYRPGGLVAGFCWVQPVPFHVQVSPRTLKLASVPPKRRTELVAAS